MKAVAHWLRLTGCRIVSRLTIGDRSNANNVAGVQVKFDIDDDNDDYDTITEGSCPSSRTVYPYSSSKLLFQEQALMAHGDGRQTYVHWGYSNSNLASSHKLIDR